MQRGFGRFQKGNGALARLLSRAWRFIVPLAKEAGEKLGPIAKEAFKAVKDEGITAGSKILDDIAHGKPVEAAIKTTGTSALKNLSKRAGNRLVQAGSGKGRSKPTTTTRPKRKRSLKNLHYVGKSVLASVAKKRKGGKSFSPY